MNLNRYNLLGVAVLALVSCNNEQLDQSSGNISFNVVLENEKPVTKSSIDMMSEDGKTCFTLEAEPMTKSVQINHSTTFTEIYDEFEVEGHEGAASEAPVFHGSAVYNSTTGKWDLVGVTPPYIWKPNKQVEIVAAASNVDNTNFFNGIAYSGTPSTANFDYALPNNPSTLKDPLYGYFKGAINSDGSASLKFNHPLTSLVFKVGRLPLNAQLQVNSITLSGIDAQAHCVVSFDNASTTYEWTNHAGRINYKQEVATPAPQDPNDIIFDETAAFIVIPRVFPEDSDAKIIINITENGREYDIFASLAGTEWKPGETNIYALSYHGERKAILASGPDFNRAMMELAGFELVNPGTSKEHRENTTIQHIVFETNSETTSTTQIQAPESSPIYMSYADNTITISSEDYEIFTGTSCSSMFSYLTALTSIEGMEYVNTKNTTDMSNMFRNCKVLADFPIEHFDTRKVETMANMFMECDRLTSIDLSPFSSESLINIELMFRNASRLTTITFGEQFTCKNVSEWGFLFAETPLSSLNWSNITPEKARDIEYMFSSCPNITAVDMSAFAASNSTIVFAAGVFGNTSKLATINMGNVDFSHIRNYDGAINNMLQNTGSSLSSYTITCLQDFKDIMLKKRPNGSYATAISVNKVNWDITNPEP